MRTVSSEQKTVVDQLKYSAQEFEKRALNAKSFDGYDQMMKAAANLRFTAARVAEDPGMLDEGHRWVEASEKVLS